MKFAVNYSTEGAELLRQGQIELDLFKCPAWPDLLPEARALRLAHVHFPLIVGSGGSLRPQPYAMSC